jgi:D-alanyl-D-alanine carboxypeptidase
MDGVVGLSGFIGLSGGRTAVFSFMFNGPVDLEPDARLLFDALADEVANQ